MGNIYLRGQVSVVLNSEFLKELCGANDRNLKIFEDLLGVGVFSRGNEIFIDTDDESVRQTFKRMIDQLEDLVRLGGHPDPDLVKAFYRSADGENRTADFLKENHVLVPRANKRIFPRSINQAFYLDALKKNEMVFAVGPAGTGKTYLAVAHALQTVLSHSVRKLILTRPVVEAGESLGFLPGDLEQKISPYLRPLYDAMESIISFNTIREMEEHRIIEIAPLAYMRGRSLCDSFVILDEAQNTTREQMMMFLTRIGEGSRVVITGDITQIDLPKNRESGLIHVTRILTHIEEISFIFFDIQDVVRNPLVRKIVHAYENQIEKE